MFDSSDVGRRPFPGPACIGLRWKVRSMLTRSCSLEVKIFSAREEAGVAAAAIAAEVIPAEIARNGKAAVVFASAVSQDPFLAAVRGRDDIDWKRITSFHLDEYAGMSDRHPASFRRFQRERLLEHVPMGKFEALNAEAADLDAEADRYAALLRAAK